MVVQASAICRAFLVFACAAQLLAAPEASAQTTDAGSLLKTVPESPLRPSAGPTFEDRLQKARPIADIEGLQVEIKQFRLTGLTVVSEADAQAVLEPYLGANKKFQDLLDATAALKKLLAGNGYFLADAIIPEQAIKDGIVEILILEGRLSKVTVETAKDVGISPEFIAGFLSELKEGAIIETDTIERAVFLLSDLKGVNIRTIFEPGERIGTANFIVQITRTRAVEGAVDFDANGSLYTGVYRVSGGVDFNNPTGLGDMLALRYSRSLETRDMEYQRLSYLSPVGSAGFKLGYAYSDLSYRLATPAFEAAKANGRANVQSILAAVPVIRSRNVNLIVSGQVDQRSFRDRQETAKRFTDKNTEVWSVGVGGDIRDALLGGGVNVYNLSHTRGKLKFAGPEGQANLAADRVGRDTADIYEKTNLTFSRLQSIDEGVAFYFSFSQQVATKNLDSSEKFSLGGPNAVRAYPQGEASGDEGWVASGEFRFRIPTGDTLPGTMVVTAYHDAGLSRLNKNMIPTDVDKTRKLAGVGLGLNWEVPGDWSMRASAAVRQTAAAQAEGTRRLPRVYFQFTKNF